MYFTENDWLTEFCPVCGSSNHIHLTHPEAHAWECWACFHLWWIDDLAKDMLIITMGIDDEEADDMLVKCSPYINIMFGHTERKE